MFTKRSLFFEVSETDYIIIKKKMLRIFGLINFRSQFCCVHLDYFELLKIINKLNERKKERDTWAPVPIRKFLHWFPLENRNILINLQTGIHLTDGKLNCHSFFAFRNLIEFLLVLSWNLSYLESYDNEFLVKSFSVQITVSVHLEFCKKNCKFNLNFSISIFKLSQANVANFRITITLVRISW